MLERKGEWLRPTGPRQLLPSLHLPPLLSSDGPSPQAPLLGWGGKGLLGCMRSAEAPQPATLSELSQA